MVTYRNLSDSKWGDLESEEKMIMIEGLQATYGLSKDVLTTKLKKHFHTLKTSSK